MAAKKENRRKAPTTKPKPRAEAPPRGTLFIIGGREDKQEARAILRAFAERLDVSRKLLIATLASEFPEERWREYQQIFHSLGVRRSEHLSLIQRQDKHDGKHDGKHDSLLHKDAAAIFFTGGDQLRITTKLGGSPLADEIDQLFQRGGLIAGTSAGASALGEMMIVGKRRDEVYHIGDVFQMSPGLGLLKNVIIDQHFSERGRIRRLLAAVAQNPRLLGIGIDEDTAIVVTGAARFEVIGSGAVYVVDGRELNYTNISEASLGETMSIFGITLHVLSHGDGFDLQTHLPVKAEAGIRESEFGIRNSGVGSRKSEVGSQESEADD